MYFNKPLPTWVRGNSCIEGCCQYSIEKKYNTELWVSVESLKTVNKNKMES